MILSLLQVNVTITTDSSLDRGLVLVLCLGVFLFGGWRHCDHSPTKSIRFVPRTVCKVITERGGVVVEWVDKLAYFLLADIMTSHHDAVVL